MRKIFLTLLLLSIPILIMCDQKEDMETDYDKFEKKFRGKPEKDQVKRN